MLNSRSIASFTVFANGRLGRSRSLFLHALYMRFLGGLAVPDGSMVVTAIGASIASALELKPVVSAASVFRLNVPLHIALYALAANLVMWGILSASSSVFAASRGFVLKHFGGTSVRVVGDTIGALN
jgi:hypothetical protein